MKSAVSLFALMSLVSPLAVAKGGDKRPRPETISCALQLPNGTFAQQKALVVGGSALVQGSEGAISYVFSVRGKTAVARLTDSLSGQVVTASGAIEMLRHGGEDRSKTPAVQPLNLFKHGDDDASDGSPEREAGFDLSITNTTGAIAKLKCESKNETGTAPAPALFSLQNFSAQISNSANPVVAGCDEDSFVEMSGDAKIMTQGRAYTPRCLKVRVGQTVTIDASTHHPLQGIPNGAGLTNPIVDEFGAAVSPKTVVFSQAGTFGFYCVAHSDETGSGMGGAILVVP